MLASWFNNSVSNKSQPFPALLSLSMYRIYGLGTPLDPNIAVAAMSS